MKGLHEQSMGSQSGLEKLFDVGSNEGWMPAVCCAQYNDSGMV